MNQLSPFLAPILAFFSGLALAWLLYRRESDLKRARHDYETASLPQKARQQAETFLAQARELAAKTRQMITADNENWQSRQETLSATLEIKDQSLKRKSLKNQEIAAVGNLEREELERITAANASGESKLLESIEAKADIAVAALREALLADLEREIHGEKDAYLLKYEHEVKDELFRVSKRIVLYAIQRFSGSTSVERTNTNVVIPREIMKGMLIGKDGTNIAFLESLFPGLQFIFEHEPKTLTISGFNLLQRNIAALTVKKLLRKKSISPSEIKKTQEQAKAEIDEDIMKEGRKALKQVGITGCSSRLVWLVGRLKYRTSYRQNILKHSIEMAFFAEMIASEIGADTQVAKIATFFHDIGKAVDHDLDTDEGHDFLTKEILEANGFAPDIVHAAYAHHDAEAQRIPEAFIVKAADAISGGRPGARQETIDSYLERIIRLEALAGAIPGVKKTYAVAAGREVRLFVDPQMIKDKDMEQVAATAVQGIEENLVYPGKIKVNVIRTLKATEVAK